MGLVNRLRGPPPVVLTQGAWGGGLRVCISNQLHFENHLLSSSPPGFCGCHSKLC